VFLSFLGVDEMVPAPRAALGSLTYEASILLLN